MKHSDKNSINIRLAKIDDAAAISDMIVRNVIHFHTDAYTAEEIQIWLRGYSVSETQKQIQNRQTFVLESEGDIYSTIQFDSPEIKGFYVDPKYKGMGYARMLFQFMLSKLKKNGLHQIELTSNKLTIGFYDHFGFELIGEETVVWENHRFIEYRMIKKH